MTEIFLTTRINAKPDIVSGLSRDIDLHQHSMEQTGEKAIAGVTSGVINLGETVTWKGKHFGIWLTHKSKITEMHHPDYFVDEMEDGHFNSFRHFHYFKQEYDGTVMVDRILYETPYGVAGRWFDRAVLKRYLTRLVRARNAVIKTMAEKAAKTAATVPTRQPEATKQSGCFRPKMPNNTDFGQDWQEREIRPQ
jgi:ligand-binding SRPBCC domain-containing protein